MPNKTLVQEIRLNGGKDIEAELKSLGRVGEQAFNALQRAADRTTVATTGFGAKLTALKASMNKVGEAAGQIGSRFSLLGTTIGQVGGAIAGAFAVKSLIDMTSAWKDLKSQVAANLKPGSDINDVMSRIADTADRTYSSLQLTAEGFAQNALVLNSLGKTTQQQLDYQEALNDALVVSGAKGERAQQVQDAMNRALAKGVVQGDDLNTILSRGGRVAELLAKKLGVPITALRALAAQGKITSEVLFEAVTGGLEDVRKEADAMPATINDAFLRINNALLRFIGTADDASGVSKVIADGLIFISEHIPEIVTGFLAIAGAFAAVKAVGLAIDIFNLGKALIALLPPLISVTIALLANPFALIAVAVVAVIAAIVVFSGHLQDVINFLTGTLIPTFVLVAKAIADWVIGAIKGIGDFAASVQQFAADFQTMVGGAVDAVVGFFSDMIDTVVGFFTNLYDETTKVIKGILDFVNKLIKAAKEAAKALFGIGGNTGDQGGGSGFAGGGPVRGPGGPTSDTIPAWLSNGEYVVRAKAVAKYGVGFLHAINSMRAPKFASGGLVDALRVPMHIPRFADGGVVGEVAAGRPLTLQIGADTFEGLIAPDTVAEKLIQFAGNRQVRRAGSTPSWYRG